jgi:hypothetical protein
VNTQPVPSSTADLFNWESQPAALTSNVVGNAGQKVSDRLQVDSDRFFVLSAYLGSTNYDASAGEFIAVVGASPGAAARALVTPPFVPNNFEVMIRQNNDTDMMGVPMPQACLCANGYRAGAQFPIPTIYAPMTCFDFDFYNVAPTLLTLADNTTAVNLQITFGLFGYFVPIEKLAAFLTSYDAYYMAAQQQLAGWIAKFTNTDMSKVPGV